MTLAESEPRDRTFVGEKEVGDTILVKIQANFSRDLFVFVCKQPDPPGKPVELSCIERFQCGILWYESKKQVGAQRGALLPRMGMVASCPVRNLYAPEGP